MKIGVPLDLILYVQLFSLYRVVIYSTSLKYLIRKTPFTSHPYLFLLDYMSHHIMGVGTNRIVKPKASTGRRIIRKFYSKCISVGINQSQEPKRIYFESFRATITL